MKLSLPAIALVFLSLNGFGQAKLSHNKFTLPSGITAADYQKGVLVAKLKPAFRSLASSNEFGRTSALPEVEIHSLANPELVRQNRLARGPLAESQFKIDLGLYVRLSVSPGSNIETKINELYATGYFEIIEPEYTARIEFTPNDPMASSQYYLSLMKVYDAWDITQSDGGTVIGVVDSGGDLDHPDLVNNLYTNPDEIPGDVIDNDHDGYIDNIHGWDFMGADTLNLYNSGFIGDNDPNLKQTGDAGNLGHGVSVAGCAAGTVNNGIGVAGVGYKTKLLFTKHTADNQKNASIFLGYSGILYVAQTLTSDGVKRKIINCSWGSSYRSQIAQDLITHVTLDLGCLVVAAAGNESTSGFNYPSSYDYVLSVAATDQNDVKATFSNFGSTVDVAAPGLGIFTTAYNDSYNVLNGTSFSSPIAAGAAALVWAFNPTFSPTQVAEQLRVTADNIDASNANFVQQLGGGRINVKSALTLSKPSIRASKPTILDSQGNTADLGTDAFLTLSFTNYLKTSGSLTLDASTTSPFVTFTKGEAPLGVINSGASVRNSLNPLKLVISANTPQNTLISIKLSITDGTYSDFQIIQVSLNPSYINVDENTITTSVASTGRIGFDDPDKELNGAGFVVKDNPILFEMGLIMGTSSTSLYNNVRGINSSFDQNFVKVIPIKKMVPGLRSTSEIFGSFSPSALPSLVINYRSLVMKEKPNDKFVIIEYTLANNGTAAISNFRFGMFADWDISDSGAKDAADWDAAHKIGYVFPKQSQSLPHAGIQALNSTASVYSIDNDQAISGNPFGLYDGFTLDEKFTSLSTVRNQAGQPGNTTWAGNDVSHVVSVSPVTIPAGGKVVLAFALHAANNLTELLASADAANTLYNQIFNIPRPTVTIQDVCYGSNTTLTAAGATKFRWYKNFTGGHPFDSLSTSITTANLFRDSTIYVSNADNANESLRTPALIKLKANPAVTATSTTICPTETTSLSVATADSYTWSNGATTQSVTVNAAGNYSVTVKYNAKNCTSTSPQISISTLTKPTAGFSTTGDLIERNTITFVDQSTNATTWSWDFGDGITSKLKNPTHLYDTPKNYTVKLSVKGPNGCQDTFTKDIGVITGLGDTGLTGCIVYPNPAMDYLSIRLSNKYEHATFTMINLQGQLVMNTTVTLDSDGSQKLFVGGLLTGMYLVRIQADNESFLRKVEIKH